MRPESESAQKPKENVVFILRTETKCAECGRDLFKGNFLRLENARPLCFDCADLEHLEYLPRGDAAVTRRTTKHSALKAVVVQWSRTRNRYERQGILAIPEASRMAASAAAPAARRLA